MTGVSMLMHPVMGAWKKIRTFVRTYGCEMTQPTLEMVGRTALCNSSFVYRNRERLIQLRYSPRASMTALAEDERRSTSIVIWMGPETTMTDLEEIIAERLSAWDQGALAEKFFFEDLTAVLSTLSFLHLVAKTAATKDIQGTDFFLEGSTVNSEQSELYWYQIPVDVKLTKKLSEIQFFLRETDNVWEFAWSEEDWGNKKKMRDQIKKLVTRHLERYTTERVVL